MDQIKELGNIVQRESPVFYAELLQTDSKKGMLFRAIMEGMVQTDNDASMLIYGKIDQGKKYQMLKKNLKEKLISHLNNTKSKPLINYALAETECKDKLNLVSSLLSNNVFHTAEKLLNQIIKKGEQYSLFNILREAAILNRELASIKGFTDPVQNWNKKIELYTTYANYHIKAKGAYEYFRAYFIHFCSLNPKMAQKAIEFEKDIVTWLKEVNSPILQLRLIQIQIYLAYHSNNINLVHSRNIELKQLINRFNFLNSDVVHFGSLLNEAKFHLVNGDLSAADFIIENSITNSEYKSFLKFEAQAVNFSVKIKQEKYEIAGDILNEVFNTYEFGLFYPEFKAAWHLRRAYLFFLLFAKGKKALLEKYVPEYTTSSIITQLDQNCKKLSKDKLGYNVKLLIIRLLLTWQNTSEETYYIGKNLQLYYYRNLKDLSELRIKSFVKNLSLIAINGFVQDEIIERKNQFEEKVVSINYTNKYDLNEIIPFETIFELMLSSETKRQ